MFQALNATGTPLTAMETFLPQVMQAESGRDVDWASTPSARSFEEIDKFFERANTNQQKNRRTNELLGAFALCHNGMKLGNRFSAQRRWITHCYEREAPNLAAKREYADNLASVAHFYRSAWYMEGAENPTVIDGLAEHGDGELASFLVQYLRDANSKLSAPILARFFIQAMANAQLVDEFVEATKACAAYFTLVRATRSTTSGLDDTYRRFFKGSDSPVDVSAHNWTDGTVQLSSAKLKSYFLSVLTHRNVVNRDQWMAASDRVLLYKELKKVVRFVLFVGGHDRVADAENPGLTIAGNRNVCPLLTLSHWNSKDLKSIEHVAPQNPPKDHDWDSEIYSADRVDQVGNLLLLPTDINRFAANQSWRVKHLHYSHLGVRSQREIDELRRQADALKVILNGKAVSALRKAQYSCVVESAVKVGLDGEWDEKLIRERTQQIKGIAWRRLMSWLTD